MVLQLQGFRIVGVHARARRLRLVVSDRALRNQPLRILLITILKSIALAPAVGPVVRTKKTSRAGVGVAELELELGSGNARGSAKKNGVWSNYYHRVLISSSFTVRQFWGKDRGLVKPKHTSHPNVSVASHASTPLRADSFAMVPALCTFSALMNRVPQSRLV